MIYQLIGRVTSSPNAHRRQIDLMSRKLPSDNFSIQRPNGDHIVIAGDLNGHFGEKIDRGKEFGARNGGDKHKVDFAGTNKFVLVNGSSSNDCPIFLSVQETDILSPSLTGPFPIGP